MVTGCSGYIKWERLPNWTSCRCAPNDCFLKVSLNSTKWFLIYLANKQVIFENTAYIMFCGGISSNLSSVSQLRFSVLHRLVICLCLAQGHCQTACSQSRFGEMRRAAVNLNEHPVNAGWHGSRNQLLWSSGSGTGCKFLRDLDTLDFWHKVKVRAQSNSNKPRDEIYFMLSNVKKY